MQRPTLRTAWRAVEPLVDLVSPKSAGFPDIDWKAVSGNLAAP